jgi:integrase
MGLQQTENREMAIHKLTPARATAFVKRERAGKMKGDGGGLYLRANGSGSGAWTFRYTSGSKTFDIGLGSTRTVTLEEARVAAREYRAMRCDPHNPRDPYTVKQAADEQRRQEAARARAAKIVSRTFAQVMTEHVSAMSNVRARLELILDYAAAREYRPFGPNPAAWKGNLDGVLPDPARVHQVKSHAALAYKDTPRFYAELEGNGSLPALALQFLILTGERLDAVLGADASEIDRATNVWKVPGSRMKRKANRKNTAFEIPLSAAALKVLDRAKTLSGSGLLFLPATQSNRVRALLPKGCTVHGFRSTFSDWAGDCTEFAHELSEEALGHKVGSKVKRAYRRGDALDKRRTLMETWAAFLPMKKMTRSSSSRVGPDDVRRTV